MCVCVCVATFASAYVIAVDQSEVTTSIHGGEWAGSDIPLVLPLLPQAGEDEVARHLLAAMRRHTHRPEWPSAMSAGAGASLHQ